MDPVKVKVPTPVVTGGGVNFDRWLELIRKIRQADLNRDLTAMQKYIADIGASGVPARPDLKLGEYDELIIRTGVMTDVDVKNAKNQLIALNAEVRQIVDKFEKDSKKIEAINKMIESSMKYAGRNKMESDALVKALNHLKRVSTTHNGLLATPLMTHAALSKVADHVRKAS